MKREEKKKIMLHLTPENKQLHHTSVPKIYMSEHWNCK
jgi:hypothetical protein